MTADAQGYMANYYNPAGLAKAQKGRWEVTPVDLEGTLGTAAIGAVYNAKSFGGYQLSNSLAAHPGTYAFYNFTALPGISTRGFGLSLLYSSTYAGTSDGNNVTMHAGETIGPSIGTAVNLAGNLLKVGFDVKALVRNEADGTFSVAQVNSPSGFNQVSREGIGVGADVGVMATLPYKWLPTLGISYLDIGDTTFHASHLINPASPGAPDAIPQSVNAAFSVHPYLSHTWHATFSVEVTNLELPNLPLQKRSHFGMQFLNNSNFYVWAGLNQLYPTGGLGLRVKGGTFELGTYAEDIGIGNQLDADRRFFFRYTIGF